MAVEKIYLDFFTMQCSACGYAADKGTPLPPITKRIVYLDQFVPTQIRKARADAAAGRPLSSVQYNWLQLAGALARTCKRQLAVCPTSWAHQVESTNATLEGRTILNVLMEFSYRVRFAQPSWIIETQIWESARRWLSCGECDLPAPDVRRVADGYALHAWRPSLTPYPASLISEGLMEGLNRIEDRGHAQLTQLWHTWRARGRGDFAAWVREEIESGVRVYRADRRIGSIVRAAVESCGPSGDEATRLVDAYLRSDCLEQIPHTRIFAILAAGLRHRAATSRDEHAKNRGMHSDMETLALLLPYCDIMLIDKDCRNLVSSNPVAEILGTKTRVYCTKDLGSMIGNLEALESTATNDHRQMVEFLYGIPASDWLPQTGAKPPERKTPIPE